MPPRQKRKAAEAAEVKAKRAKGETDLDNDLKWGQAGEVLSKGVYPMIYLSSDTLKGCTKAVGFDIDFTVIETKSGRKFATGATDWQFWSDEVPVKLKQLNKDGYRVIFFTNQAGIEKLKVKPEEVMTKIEAIIKALDIPVLAFVSTGNSHFRKPATAMWDFFVSNCNGGVKVNLDECIYVGDAAGRAKEWAPGKGKDFSCSDRMFAANIGIKFQTPEEFFKGEKAAPFKWGSLNPTEFVKTCPKDTDDTVYHSKNKEMIIMVGPPASGKSTFSRRHLKPHGYEIVNRDTLKTPAKCIKAAEESLKKGKSVVIDNTNPAKYARADYIKIAKKAGVGVRCFCLQTSVEIAHHLNYVRQNQTNGEVRRIPDVGYAVYNKNYEEPETSEGFTEVKKIDFKLKFDNNRDEMLFKQWTTGGH